MIEFKPYLSPEGTVRIPVRSGMCSWEVRLYNDVSSKDNMTLILFLIVFIEFIELGYINFVSLALAKVLSKKEGK